VASQFPIVVSHLSTAFLRVIRLTVLATQLTAVLYSASRVTWHGFINLCLCYIRRSRPGTSLFKSESAILLVYSLYAKPIEAVKSRAALSAASPELILILGEINSEARLWNRYQSVNLSIRLERFLVLAWSSRRKTTGRWSESRVSEKMTSDSRTFSCIFVA
jgi:hypothetical protein